MIRLDKLRNIPGRSSRMWLWSWCNTWKDCVSQKSSWDRILMLSCDKSNASLWRHNERDCGSNHQPQDCLLKRLFRRRSNMFPFDDVLMDVMLGTPLGNAFRCTLVQKAVPDSWQRLCYTSQTQPSTKIACVVWSVNTTKLNRQDWTDNVNIVNGSAKIHYNDVIVGAMASETTSLTIVYSTVYSRRRSKDRQNSASLAFVRGIHRWPMNSPHKGPAMRKLFPFDDVIMIWIWIDSVCRRNIHTVLALLFILV